jgi:hypothetical protein
MLIGIPLRPIAVSLSTASQTHSTPRRLPDLDGDRFRTFCDRAAESFDPPSPNPTDGCPHCRAAVAAVVAAAAASTKSSARPLTAHSLTDAASGASLSGSWNTWPLPPNRRPLNRQRGTDHRTVLRSHGRGN